MLETLNSAGTNLNNTWTHQDATLIHFASHRNILELETHLVFLGVDRNYQDYTDITALHHPALYTNNLKLMNMI